MDTLHSNEMMEKTTSSQRELRDREKKQSIVKNNGSYDVSDNDDIVLAVDKYKCRICSKLFLDRSALNTHKKTHTDVYAFSCDFCPFKCKIKKYLSRHVKRNHTEPEKHFKCDVCGKLFYFQCKLNTHMRVHTGEKPYKCDVCGKAFNSNYSLSTHRYIHTDEKPYRCSFCSYACRDGSTLRKHESKHMGVERMYQCKMCQKRCKSKSQLKMHIAETHLEVDVKKHACTICGRKFKQKGSLTNHIQTVHEKSKACKCELCGHVISNRANMPAHMRTHVDARPYKCTYTGCGKRFKDNNTLKKHTAIHYPEKHYPCKLCGRMFVRHLRLKTHMLQHRERVKRVECHHCGVCFYNKNYLACHIRRKHDRKRKKYICDMCDFVTPNKPSLVMHIKYGHDTGDGLGRPCKLCEKIYRKDISLRLHYWQAHGIKFKVRAKPDTKKPLPVIIKEEPMDEDNVQLMEINKTESPDDVEDPNPINMEDFRNVIVNEGTARHIIQSNGKRLSKVPEMVFDDHYIEHVIKPPHWERVKSKPRNKHVDQRAELYVRKCVKRLLVETRQIAEARALERARRQYNERLERSLKHATVEEPTKIKYFNNNNKHTHLFDETNLEETSQDNSLLIARKYEYSSSNYESEEKCILNKKCVENSSSNDKCILQIDENSENTSSDDKKPPLNDVNDKHLPPNDNKNDENSQLDAESDDETLLNFKNRKSNNRKIKFSAQQCYVCFKLFQTKEKLIEHCKDHFNICNETMLTKCPLCEYVTVKHLTKHMKIEHNINITLLHTRVKDKNDPKHGSRYFFPIEDHKINEIQVIPSIKHLNKCASVKIDEKNREIKNRLLAKTKLVRKGEEWVVEKEKIDVKIDYLLPEFDENDYKLIKTSLDKNDYISVMKQLSSVAKRKGAKILYPCDGCEKICQNLCGLKLHRRKHEENPKPFKPKVWKHKIKKSIKKPEKLVKVKANVDNRIAPPKPITNKHKCDPKLKEFYEKNIRGKDIEFWHFLKIYNKMSRENIKNFDDLNKHNDFGVHHYNGRDDDFEHSDQVVKGVKKLVNKSKKSSYTRVIRLSKTEYMKRNAIKNMLREKHSKDHNNKNNN